jgi:Flp pilus assembly CpaF family ATPase
VSALADSGTPNAESGFASLRALSVKEVVAVAEEELSAAELYRRAQEEMGRALDLFVQAERTKREARRLKRRADELTSNRRKPSAEDPSETR